MMVVIFMGPKKKKKRWGNIVREIALQLQSHTHKHTLAQTHRVHDSESIQPKKKQQQSEEEQK